MNQRECLGEWYEQNSWTKEKEINKINEVIYKGQTTSRLTGGINKDIPIAFYTITYLYENIDNTIPIRGWHGIKYTSFYLPDVLLENTYDNGTWIYPHDVEWNQDQNFKIK